MLLTILSLAFALAVATTAHPSPQGKGKGAKGGSGGCSAVEMIFARGTMEAQGFGMVGQPLVAATKSLLPAFTALALKYPAGWGDSSPAQGVKAVLEYLETKPKQCPQQKYVLSGYSQGAVVMHRAAVKLSPEVLNKIIATVTFGDGGQQAPGKPNNIYKSPVGEIPAWPKALNGRIRFNCNGNDITCKPGGSSTADHLQYATKGTYIRESAKFIKTQFDKLGSASAAQVMAAMP